MTRSTSRPAEASLERGWSPPPLGPSLFRAEALAHHSEGAGVARPLRVAPAWVRLAFWLILAIVLALVSIATFATVNEYASGSAMVRIEGATDVTAPADGNVAKVLVIPGQRVAAGEVLVQLDDAEQRAEWSAAEREFELELLQVLRQPADRALRESLAAVRARKELALAKLTQRSLVAPTTGEVSDVRIRPGMHLESGDPVLSVIGAGARITLLAFLPGSYRPLLRPGLPLHFEVQGYDYAYQMLRVQSLGNQVVGANEIRRYLGAELADAVAVNGAVIVVTAEVPARTFEASGRRLQYFDGMIGRAEVEVRSEPLAFSLFPPLKALRRE